MSYRLSVRIHSSCFLTLTDLVTNHTFKREIRIIAANKYEMSFQDQPNTSFFLHSLVAVISKDELIFYVKMYYLANEGYFIFLFYSSFRHNEQLHNSSSRKVIFNKYITHYSRDGFFAEMF